jgi:hypothetical protein
MNVFNLQTLCTEMTHTPQIARSLRKVAIFLSVALASLALGAAAGWQFLFALWSLLGAD